MWKVICYFQNRQDGLIGKSFNQILIVLFFSVPTDLLASFTKAAIHNLERRVHDFEKTAAPLSGLPQKTAGLLQSEFNRD